MSAIDFFSSIDLNKQQLLNAVLHGLATDPANPVDGQIYFNTTSKVYRYFDATANAWQTLASTSTAGLNGWTPVLALEEASGGVYLKVVDWTGSTGTKPPINVYIGSSGFVGSIANATNLRDAGTKFTADLLVNLSGGKTFGRYGSGQTIPANGKSAVEVIAMAVAEPIAPTVNLTSPSSVLFGVTAVSNVLNFSFSINSSGATVTSASLEWRRNNSGSWNVLSTSTSNTTFTHNFAQARFDTTPINYRYVVTDSAGASNTATFNVSPQGYAAPSISQSINATALNGSQTNILRELGNISSGISASFTSSRPNVAFISAIFQRRLNGGAWVNIGTQTAQSGTSGSIPLSTHNDNALAAASTIEYRVEVVDEFTTSYSSIFAITFRSYSYLGFDTGATATSALVYALENPQLLSARGRTVNGVTAAVGEFTYIAYPASFGNLSGIIQDGATPVLGAFTLVAPSLVVTNQYGQAATYLVYRSNNTNAFTNNQLVLS